jgi:hypothetical protein
MYKRRNIYGIDRGEIGGGCGMKGKQALALLA